MIERILRWFAKFRKLEERNRQLEIELDKLRIQCDGLKEQVEVYKNAVRDLGNERSFLQDRYVEAKEELRTLQDNLLKALTQSSETSQRPSKSSFDGKPILPARTQVYRKVNEANREFYQSLQSRLNDGAEVTA